MTATRRHLAILILGMLACGVTLAQTTDGETPATESVCDVLLEPGVTPGLYGLCVAYCEAHDGDDLSEVDLVCNPSDDKILDNYNRKKTETDPPMPCLQPECPCWTLDELWPIVVEEAETGCWLYTCYEKAKYGPDGELLALVESRIGYEKYLALIAKDVGGTRCAYRGPLAKRSVDRLTWEQILACHDLIHQAADDACFGTH